MSTTLDQVLPTDYLAALCLPTGSLTAAGAIA